MNKAIEQRMSLGAKLAQQAGIRALSFFVAKDLSIRNKGPGDLVTEADFAIENMLRQTINSHFHNDAIIGEEMGGTAANGFTWLIDPIDGTVNFARHLPYFCVSIALLYQGKPVGAWINDPLSNEIFWADADGRAFVNGAPVACSKNAMAKEAVIGLGFSQRHKSALAADVIDALTATGAEFRRFGSGALCLAHVAAGRLDAYFEPHMNPWDAVGGLYIAACAGAITFKYPGPDGLKKGGAVLAASPFIIKTVLDFLPAPYSGTPLHRQNDQRSAGQTATNVAPSTPSGDN